jgi:hypothetical protein
MNVPGFVWGFALAILIIVLVLLITRGGIGI